MKAVARRRDLRHCSCHRLSSGADSRVLRGRIEVRDFVASSRASRCELTVAYAKYTYRSPYGVLSLEDGAVQGIAEKPETEYAISAGRYCLSGVAMDMIPRETFFTMPDLMKKLLAVGKRIHAYPIPGTWMGLESIEYFNEAVWKFQTE